MSFSAKLEMDSMQEILSKRNLETGGEVQKYIDSEVIRQCAPYTPFRSGMLDSSAEIATIIGSGEVVYDTPYAHYLWQGDVMGPNIPIIKDGVLTGFFSPPKKEYTGEKLQYDLSTHPLAGSHWFERSMADHKHEILEGASKVAGSKHN
jgi:hypothetical protein